jgi:hypothetical protein
LAPQVHTDPSAATAAAWMPPAETWTMFEGRPWICTGVKVLTWTLPSTPM